MNHLPGPPIAARLGAVLGGISASAGAFVIYTTAALPLSWVLELTRWLGPEMAMPWVIAVGLATLGWIPALAPRSGWLVGIAMVALGVLALLFADFGGYLLGTLAAFVAAALFFASAKKARRARKAAKQRAKIAPAAF